MPLSILIPMILIGLPLVIGLVWWVSKDKGIEGLTQSLAIQRFKQDFPNDEAEDVVVSEDGMNAILKLAGRAELGLVHRVGQNYLTRMIDQNSVKCLDEKSSGFTIHFRDFTLKKVEFTRTDGLFKEQMSKALNPER